MVDTVTRTASTGRTALRVAVPIILGLGVVAGLGLAALAAGRALSSAAATVPGLLLALLPLICLYLLIRFALTGQVHGERRGRSSNRRGLLGPLLGGVFRALTGLARAIARSGSIADGLSDASTEVHRFRADVSGNVRHDCEMVGELRGAALRKGDAVRITGRLDRRGVVGVRRVEVVATGATVTARPSAPYVMARVGTVLALLLLAVAIVVAVRL